MMIRVADEPPTHKKSLSCRDARFRYFKLILCKFCSLNFLATLFFCYHRPFFRKGRTRIIVADQKHLRNYVQDWSFPRPIITALCMYIFKFSSIQAHHSFPNALSTAPNIVSTKMSDGRNLLQFSSIFLPLDREIISNYTNIHFQFTFQNRIYKKYLPSFHSPVLLCWW
jgi:hypothetical protein